MEYFETLDFPSHLISNFTLADDDSLMAKRTHQRRNQETKKEKREREYMRKLAWNTEEEWGVLVNSEEEEKRLRGEEEDDGSLSSWESGSSEIGKATH